MPQIAKNSFSGGMNKDVNEINVPKGNYIHSENGVIAGNVGDLSTNQNEQGQIPAGLLLNNNLEDIINNNGNYIGKVTDDYSIIGHCWLNEDIIVFSVNTLTGCSEVGIFKPIPNTNKNQYEYQVILNDCNCDCTGLTDPTEIDNCNEFQPLGINYKALNFKITHQIDCQARLSYDFSRRVYFTETYDDSVGVNNPPRYLNLEKKCYEYADLTEELKLFASYKHPKLEYKDQVIGGNLRVGMYFFTARYLTDTLDPLAFTFVTNGIPVVDDVNNTSSQTQYDGQQFDGPRTSKAIRLDVTGLDTTFKYVEFAVIFYEGAALEPRSFVFRRLTVPTSGNITITYTGDETEDTQEVDLSQITQIFANYASAKHLIVKDGRLFLSNLTTSEEDYAYQSLANCIRIKWFTEEIPVASQTNDSDFLESNYQIYKKEYNTYDLKGYKRGEIYSFAISFIFKDGSTSLAYHIPGNDHYSGFSFNAVDDLETYTSILNYSTEGLGTNNYVNNPNPAIPPIFVAAGGPNSFLNNKIRHHKIPDLEVIPAVENQGDFNNVTPVLKPLGLKFVSHLNPLDTIPDLINLLPLEIQRKISGYIILRESRDTSEKRSIISQGIMHNFCGRGLIACNNFAGRTYSLRLPYPYSGYDLADTGMLDGQGYGLNHDGDGDGILTVPAKNVIQSFVSPETNLFLDFNIPQVYVKPVRVLYGKKIRNKIVEINGGNDTAGLTYFYTNYATNGPIANTQEVNKELLIDKVKKVLENTDWYCDSVAPSYFDYTEDMGAGLFNYKGRFYWTHPEWQLLTFINPNNGNARDYFKHPHILQEELTEDTLGINDGSSAYTTFDYSGAPQAIGNVEGDINERYLFELYRKLDAQYGNISAASYIPVFVQLDKTKDVEYRDPLNYSIIKTGGCFNGDTFITRFCVKATTRIVTELNGTNNPTIYGKEGYIIGILHTLYLESDINCDYRHRAETYDDFGNIINQGVKYYPKEKNIDAVLNQDPSFGDSHGYNVQYSLENNIKKFFNLGLGINLVNKFPTRTIWSQPSIENEQSDQYRIFLANNYMDLPKETGEITNQFLQDNNLYLHTEHALWRTFVNEQTAIPTNNNQLILGNGGIFTPISQKLRDIEGGDLGCVSKWACVNTPFGYIFPDMIRKKIYMLSGGIEEITQGVNYFMFNNLYINEHKNNPCNPNSNGLLAAWDDVYKRYILTKKTGNPETEFTISYSFYSKSFTHFHSYRPLYYIFGQTKLFSMLNFGFSSLSDVFSAHKNRLWLHNEGDYGVLYDNYLLKTLTDKNYDIVPYKLLFVVNDGQEVEKVFDNIEFHTESLNLDAYPIKDCFNKLRIFTRHQNSDLIDLIQDDNIKLKKNHYQTALRRSLTLNPSQAVFDTNNIQIFDEYDNLSRVKDKALKVEVIYLNKNNYKFLVNSILTFYRPIFR